MITYNTFDTKSRLVAARTYASGTLTDSATYILDALDRTLSETELHAGTTTRTDFVYIGLSGAVGQEQLFNASGALTETKSYTYDAVGRRMTLTDAVAGGVASRYGYVFDPHGSVELLIDQNRTVKASYGYDAYGNSNLSLTKTAAGVSAGANPYRFAGRRYDTGSGTIDFGARPYSASTGRFIQRDAYFGALNDLGLSTDPIAGNRYALCGANPINFVEGDGHRFISDDGSPLPRNLGISNAPPISVSTDTSTQPPQFQCFATGCIMTTTSTTATVSNDGTSILGFTYDPRKGIVGTKTDDWSLTDNIIGAFTAAGPEAVKNQLGYGSKMQQGGIARFKEPRGSVSITTSTSCVTVGSTTVSVDVTFDKSTTPPSMTVTSSVTQKVPGGTVSYGVSVTTPWIPRRGTPELPSGSDVLTGVSLAVVVGYATAIGISATRWGNHDPETEPVPAGVRGR